MQKEELEAILLRCKRGDLVEVTEFDRDGRYHSPVFENPQLIARPYYFEGISRNAYCAGDVGVCLSSAKNKQGYCEPGFVTLSHAHIERFERAAEKYAKT